MSRPSGECAELQELIQAAYPLVKELAGERSRGGVVTTATITAKDILLNGGYTYLLSDKNRVLSVLKDKIPVFERNVAQALYLTVMEIPEVSALYMSGFEPLATRWSSARDVTQNIRQVLNKLIFNDITYGDDKVERELASIDRLRVDVPLHDPTNPTHDSNLEVSISFYEQGRLVRYDISTLYPLLAITNFKTFREVVGTITDFRHRLSEVRPGGK